MTLIELAIAFVLRHPAVTAAIIGPGTMEHLESQLAADVELPGDVLDRIDEIVAPDTTSTPPTTGGSVLPCRQRRGAGKPPWRTPHCGYGVIPRSDFRTPVRGG
jgi:hypothetical protein